MKLDIARAEVVHDRIAGDVVLRLRFGNVFSLASNDTGQFQLIVQLRSFQWPRQVFVRPNNGPVIPLVVDRGFVPFRRNRLTPLFRRGGNVIFKGDEVAVMVESKTPFTVRPEMETVEIKDYALSWSRR